MWLSKCLLDENTRDKSSGVHWRLFWILYFEQKLDKRYYVARIWNVSDFQKNSVYNEYQTTSGKKKTTKCMRDSIYVLVRMPENLENSVKSKEEYKNV